MFIYNLSHILIIWHVTMFIIFNKCILSLDKKVLDFDKTICRELIHVRSLHMKYCEWCFHLLVIQLNR